MKKNGKKVISLKIIKTNLCYLNVNLLTKMEEINPLANSLFVYSFPTLMTWLTARKVI